MNKATFTFRVDEELKDSFSMVAKSMDRTGAQLLRDYMRDVVHRQKEEQEYNAWLYEQVQIGLESAHTGTLVSNQEVEEIFAVRRADTRLKLDQ